jgi:hypothetical protein
VRVVAPLISHSCSTLISLSARVRAYDARTVFKQLSIVATVLDKQLKRQVTIDGVDYTIALDPDGFRLTGKGKRTPQVELRWRDLLSGDAAMAVALNASLMGKRQPATKVAAEHSPDPVKMRPPKNPER